MLAENEIISALKEVFDPEIPLNIYDLGFIYNIGIEENTVNILMTLTVPGCPMHQVLTGMVKEKLLTLPDETVVLPGHNYGSMPTSTIGHEKKYNPFLN